MARTLAVGKSIKSRLALCSLPQHIWQYLGNGCSNLFFGSSLLSAFPICTLLPLLEGFSRECIHGGSPSGTTAGLSHCMCPARPAAPPQVPSRAVLDLGPSA